MFQNINKEKLSCARSTSVTFEVHLQVSGNMPKGLPEGPWSPVKSESFLKMASREKARI